MEWKELGSEIPDESRYILNFELKYPNIQTVPQVEERMARVGHLFPLGDVDCVCSKHGGNFNSFCSGVDRLDLILNGSCNVRFHQVLVILPTKFLRSRISSLSKSAVHNFVQLALFYPASP